jgi:dTDP-4-amino-4,6-dideoxygalactose transaminase
MIDAATQCKPVELPSDQTASGRTLGEQEIANLAEAIRSGTLTSTKGTFVNELQRRFAELLSVDHTYACSSGTAALHTAYAAIDPEPGDEIVTTSITDMGALTPILYQGAIPVFADVDPATCNVTAETIQRVLSDRTKAIVVTHLFGNPCRMGEIMDLARARNLPVIEDCAQAFCATYRGKHVGTIGDIGCFSLQQGKHITTGEGGLVVTNNADLARRMFLYVNKAWGYGDPKPDHYFMALNYRMSELQGAVAAAQLEKLADVARRRIAAAQQLREKIKDIAGIASPVVDADAVHTYWKYVLNVDADQIPGGAVALGKALRDRGVACAPRYIQKPAFRCEIFAKQRTFGNSRWPFTLARPDAVNYDRARFPGTFAGLEQIIVLPWNEFYTEEHLEYLAESIREAAQSLK